MTRRSMGARCRSIVILLGVLAVGACQDDGASTTDQSGNPVVSSASSSTVTTRHEHDSASPPAGVVVRRDLGRSDDGRYLTEVDSRAILVTGEPDGTAPTAVDRRRARRFARAVLAAADEFRDVTTAEARGYRQVDEFHWVYPDLVDDGRVADPAVVESLIYVTARGDTAQLVGVMFIAPGDEHGPTIAGPLTPWHYHEYEPKMCVVSGGFPVSEAPADAQCPRGDVADRSPEMLHVWFEHPVSMFSETMVLEPGKSGADHP